MHKWYKQVGMQHSDGSHAPIENYNKFVKEFLNKFGNPNQQLKNHDALKRLCQGRDQSVSEYITKFTAFAAFSRDSQG